MFEPVIDYPLLFVGRPRYHLSTLHLVILADNKDMRSCLGLHQSCFGNQQGIGVLPQDQPDRGVLAWKKVIITFLRKFVRKNATDGDGVGGWIYSEAYEINLPLLRVTAAVGQHELYLHFLNREHFPLPL